MCIFVSKPMLAWAKTFGALIYALFRANIVIASQALTHSHTETVCMRETHLKIHMHRSRYRVDDRCVYVFHDDIRLSVCTHTYYNLCKDMYSTFACTKQ